MHPKRPPRTAAINAISSSGPDNANPFGLFNEFLRNPSNMGARGINAATAASSPAAAARINCRPRSFIGKGRQSLWVSDPLIGKMTKDKRLQRVWHGRSAIERKAKRRWLPRRIIEASMNKELFSLHVICRI